MSDDDPHAPIRLALRVAWIISLPFAALLLWILDRLRLPWPVVWFVGSFVLGTVITTGRFVFSTERYRRWIARRSPR